MSQPRSTVALRARRWGPVAGWVAVILTLTSWPSPDIGPGIPGLDKVVHFSMYGILGLLVARALDAPRALAARVNALTAMLVFAFADELHQLLIPGRSASVWDWTADATGALAGLLIGLHLLSLARTRQDLPT